MLTNIHSVFNQLFIFNVLIAKPNTLSCFLIDLSSQYRLKKKKNCFPYLSTPLILSINTENSCIEQQHRYFPSMNNIETFLSNTLAEIFWKFFFVYTFLTTLTVEIQFCHIFGELWLFSGA